jgi:glycosyltransferase involved in cell wall biosynthesis
MRILYPLMWSRPDRKACRQQTMSTVAALARRGHDVILLMPQGRDDPALSAEALRDYFQVEGDFRIAQRPSRWAGEALGRTLLWLRQVFGDPALSEADLIYSRIPAMLGMGGRSPLPFAVDHYRPWPDDLPVIRPLLRRTARDPKCLGLILHSDYSAGAYRRAGVAEAKLLLAHNGAEPLPDVPPARAEARARLALPADRPVAVYAGRVNEAKGLDQILALADLRPDVLFLLVGSEGEGPIEVAGHRRANVRIVPWQAPADLPAWLAAADALLVPASRAPLDRFRNCVLPLKLFAYLAAGRPILAPEAPDTAELLQDGENALLVEPGKPEAAAVALDRILGDRGLAARLSRNAATSAAGLTWDRRAEKIEAFLEARLSAPNRPGR